MQITEYLPKNLHFMDLHMIHFGKEDCKPGHYSGPSVRDYYKIHFILEGEGIFEVGDKQYQLSKNQGFLICPSSVTYYKADESNPWQYCWIGFSGLKAEFLLKQANLKEDSPVFSFEQNDLLSSCLEMMIASKSMEKGREAKLTGLLYLWLSLLIQHSPQDEIIETIENRQEKYVSQVVHFIEMNYANRITVAGIASFVGLQRSYLCSLFKETIGSSIQEHLIQYRMRKACELILNPSLSVGDVARSIGYDDPLLFSKMFKKVIKLSPSEYRKQNTVTESPIS